MIRLFRSFGFAFAGIWSAVKSERNFRIHIIAMCAVIVLGVYLELPALSWGMIIFSIGLVLAAELFNTAIERLGDNAEGGVINDRLKKVKDISAGAVLISALTALAIGILFLFIPFVQKISIILQ